MPNRLAHEASLYLRQHEQHPVDWYPWGEEALRRARDENRPILLSVGYSSCHWCHVMAHECFENAEIAKILNERFISIKVDREERPDLDAIYQNVAQIFTQGGGWPLTVFLMPDLRPFYGGTYFPPEDKFGRPGFKRVLVTLSELWQQNPAQLQDNAARIFEVMEKIRQDESLSSSVAQLSADLDKAANRLIGYHDTVNGGFGSAPKFPNTMNLTFLWRTGNHEAVLHSLTKMAEGGIFDQVGGGFHRYSVDATWSVPHFEKMLYDQALLLKLYSEVLCFHRMQSILTADQERLYRHVVSMTTEYLEREMRASSGLYYSAQDADTPQGEGLNYTWTLKQVRETFESLDADIFEKHYGVSESGNFEHGQTVLYIATPLSAIAAQQGIHVSVLEKSFQEMRQKARTVRSLRPQPDTDKKHSVAINGLLLSALAWASQALQDETLRSYAVELGKSLIHFGYETDNRHLHSTVYDVKGIGKGFIEDYAYLAQGFLDLCRILPDDDESLDYWNRSRGLLDVILTEFVDESGEFFQISDRHEKLIQRPRSSLDQAVPSAAAVAMIVGLVHEDLRVQPFIDQHAGLIASHSFSSGELSSLLHLREKGVIHLTMPGEKTVFLHPRIYRKPISGQQVSQFCFNQACHRYKGFEALRKILF